ncbi:Translocation protein SEC62 [Sarcoptes scabiei]|uniref:Translocation protein SEC62 n=1 Tax=Sarcoptes scabiei TaxID=52283 RepID=A0A834R8L6_SARSC|nr:Translocation protein SEC62 [Sarcoptes scabiei]
MAERRRNRKKPEAIGANIDKPEKIEYEIAKFIRSRLPQKQTTLLGHKVDYFIASRAIDLLMDSKYAQSNKRNDEVMFPSRESVVSFMNTMLRHQFFHRAKTIIVKKEIKKKIDNTNQSVDQSTDDGGTNTKSSSSTLDKSKMKKEKKKVKLDMHMDQVFVDCNEPYVWIYDYIPMKTWLIGGGLVLAAIAICLFPLWPRTVRNYVYYISIAVAVFLFFIIALALLKSVVFVIVWALTLGRHHLWILPNLTEDVGFFESFWPLYKHEYRSNTKGSDEKKEHQEQKQQKQSHSSSDEKNDDDSKSKLITDCSKPKNDDDEEEDDDDDDEEVNEDDGGSDKDSEDTNGKLVNDFEILDSNDCEENVSNE